MPLPAPPPKCSPASAFQTELAEYSAQGRPISEVSEERGRIIERDSD